MRLVIEFQKPPGVGQDDIAQFVLDALSSWGGGLHPEDPMFHSLRDRIRWIQVHGKKFVIQSEEPA